MKFVNPQILTNSKILNMEQLRQEMIANARAYNKFLTAEHFKGKGFKRLLANTHPLDRDKFVTRFLKLTRTTEEFGQHN